MSSSNINDVNFYSNDILHKIKNNYYLHSIVLSKHYQVLDGHSLVAMWDLLIVIH